MGQLGAGPFQIMSLPRGELQVKQWPAECDTVKWICEGKFLTVIMHSTESMIITTLRAESRVNY